MDLYYKSRLSSSTNQGSILDLLISRGDLSKEETFSEAVLMLFAGTDTTSNMLSWIHYLLMTHPEISLKVTEELRLVSLPLDYQTCTDVLPYLQAVIKEALRVYPVAPGTPVRLAPPAGITIKGYNFPAGTELAVPIYSLHRSPFLWKNPDNFVPERWLHDNLDGRNYMPFLMGPRACIGKK